MTILEVVRPIIIRTYGQSEHTLALSERLAGRLAVFEPDWRAFPQARRRMVASICWDWMADAPVADGVALQIEAALSALHATGWEESCVR